MSAKEMQNTAVQTTTHYWGYREIDPTEFKYVGGGYDGDTADNGAAHDSGGDNRYDGVSGADTYGGSDNNSGNETVAGLGAFLGGWAAGEALNFGIGAFINGIGNAVRETLPSAPATTNPAPGATPSTPSQGNQTFTISSAEGYGYGLGGSGYNNDGR